MDKNLKSFLLEFKESQKLSDEQVNQFDVYYKKLVQTNEIHNLTAITDPQKVINDHFKDSLILGDFIDLNNLNFICDIGTGAGFPAIPLKIIFPKLKILLIEVNKKKIEFLKELVNTLNLSEIEFYDLDFRTFIRKTSYNIDLFCSRASLHPDELIRLFKPSSPYKNSILVYWASKNWISQDKEKNFIFREETYEIDNKIRRLIFFKS